MRILVDENIPWLTVQVLREAGYNVRDDWPGLTVVMRDEVQSIWRASTT